MKLMQVEAVMVSQLIAAILTLLVAFGAPMTEEQRKAVLQVVGAVLPILMASGVLARSQVWSRSSVEKIVAGDPDAPLP
jgi:hypothetical protein